MKEADDDVLVTAARGGSSDAFGALVHRYHVPVVRLAYRLTRDADEAKDIAQDAFMRAYLRIESLRPERPFSRWIFVIAKNASLDALRRRKRAETAALAEAGAGDEVSPEEVVLRNDDAVRLHRALEELPPKYRNVLERYYLLDQRYREIAFELGIPLGTVKTLISRAKRRLRVEFAEDETPLAA